MTVIRLLERALGAVFLLFLAAAPLSAQQNRQPAADPALVAASSAFERFEMAERRAIQRDLIWVSGFQGAATGEFGPLTFAALRRLDETLKKPVDGVLNAEKRRALANAAEAARRNMSYRIETDSASGMRIGVPGKVLSKRSTNPSGLSRWQDADGKITLDLSIGKPEDDLAQLFERGTATNVAGRKITYKLLRPDFFVISGETQTGKFYRRLEKGKDGKLRGFSLGYDKSLAGGFDWMVIAIAASFEAEPGPQPTSVASANPPATTTQVPARPAVVEPRRLTAIEIAPGRLLASAASLEKCRSVTFGSPAVTLQIEKKANGLALLSLPRPGGAVVGLAANADPSAILLQRGRAGELMIGEARITEAQAEVPLQAGGGGAPLIDRNGQLQGIIIEEPRDKLQIAGVVLAGRYRIATGKEIAAFADLQPAAAGSAPKAMSAVATEAGRSVLGLTCVE